jgi:DDE superfamily endonuclease
MEEVLDLYERPYDPTQPVVCFDERPCQLLAETRAPLPLLPGRPARYDYTYRRRGSANVFGYLEPLRGWRHMEVTTRRTKRDFAHCMRRLVDEFYPTAEFVHVVLDNLNTHTKSALYETFPAPLAQRLARKLVFHYTPLHGSWLNAVEIEFAVLSKQCLDRRLGDRTMLAQEVAVWEGARNATAVKVDWQFRTADARIKLKRLYPTFAN